MLPREPSASRTRQSMPLTWEMYPSHPGYGLNPERVWNIFMGAECGYPQPQIDLFEDLLENDGHLRSVQRARLDSVSGKTWVLQAGDPENSASVEGAQALAERLRGCSLNFLDLVEHLLESVPFGYAGGEIEWDFADRMFFPVHFWNAPHRRWVFKLEDGTGDLRLLTRKNESTGELPDAGHWIINKQRHTNPARAGLMRSAAWFAMFKRFAVRDWVIAAEKFGIPHVIGRYAPNTSAAGIAAVAKAVKDLGEAGQGTLPDSAQIELLEIGQRGGSIEALHPSIVRMAEMQCSKLFTGSVLTSDTGPSNGGSWALGNIHANVRFDLVQADERRLSHVFARDIGAAFFKWNGFPGAPPLLKHHIAQEVDQLQRMKVFEIGQRMGYPVAGDQVGDEMGFRPAKDGNALEAVQQNVGTENDPEKKQDPKERKAEPNEKKS